MNKQFHKELLATDVAAADQWEAFYLDIKRVRSELAALRFQSWYDQERCRREDELKHELAALVNYAHTQGLPLTPPSERKSRLPISWWLTRFIVIFALVAVAYMFIGILAVHLVGVALFFLVGVELGRQFTQRSMLDMSTPLQEAGATKSTD
jgi:Flp pilus assembly protein TadB